MLALGSENVPAPGKSALGDWLTGKTVPGPDHTRFFLVLVLFLQKQAVHKPHDGYLARPEGWWAGLLVRARQERDERRGGRPPRRPSAVQPPAGPVKLPPPPDGFTGRTTVLTRVLAGLEPDTEPAGPGTDGPAEITVVASSVAGMGGVGKTAVALQAAHQARVRGWFPGGILFADLRGYNPGSALYAGEVADRFLRALGVKAKDIPPAAEEKCAAWHQELTHLADQGRPLLAVLDNVRDPGQIEALLPWSPHRVLITSRQKLSNLPARRIDLDPLSPAEALDLLKRALQAGGTGDTRTTDEPAAAQKLVRLCGYLPLALRIIAALLGDSQHRTLHDQVDDLDKARTRLDGMTYSGTDREGRSLEVRASFELSYRHLTAPQAQAFRLLSAAAGPDISTTAAQQLLDRPDARRVLDDLARAYLLDSSGDERWAMHDLIGLFADELGHTHAASDKREAAIGRLHHHYRTMTTAADTHLNTRPGPHSPHFADRRAALAWLDAEHPNLIETATSAPVLGHPDTSTALAFSLARYLDYRRRFDDWITITTTALTVCRELGDRHGEGGALNNLGLALAEVRRFEEAITAHTQAAAIARKLGDRHGEGQALGNLGLALRQVRRFEEAITAHTQDLDICRVLGDRHGEGQALGNLGLALRQVRRFEEAITAHTQAAAIFRELGDRHSEGQALGNLGLALAEVRRFEEAITAHTQATAIARELGDRHREGTALNNLGSALAEVRRFEEAITAHTQAAAIFRELGDRHSEGQALGNLGLALRQVRRFEEAITAHTQATAIARELGDRHREGTALN
ncbi:tetratricopeptide repeat protein, partial [Streptomyces sp. NPDC051597]|uniref:ATP-binding protein n=1 Tax=Streptomyces sp. NPDC051597 TaxID=3155049 RepID=UPI00344574B6